jgi:myo-inositol 2-dehydrogenase / D-chiro-inositol 1-dehydrogenase
MNDNKLALNRRQFLARTSAVGAGLATANLTLPPSVFAAGSDLIRVGLVGCAGRGSGAADQTLSVAGSNVKLTAVADVFEDRATGIVNLLKPKHGDKVDVPPERVFVGFDAYQKVLEHCDLVLLCTPPAFRPYQFDAAVKAGKHAFLEKPACVDAFGARMVLAAAKETDRKRLKVVMGLQKRYEPWYSEVVQRVRDGAIGDLIAVQVYRNAAEPWYRQRQPGTTEMQFQVNNWYHFNWLCPGPIVEGHVHDLDIANWILDAVPVSASGMGGQQARRPERPSEVFDHFYVEYRYPNDVIMSSQSRQILGCKNEVREEFHGTKGVLRTPMGEIRDYKGKLMWRYEHPKQGVNPNPYQIEHDVLHAAIRENRPVNNAHYGATSSFTAVLGAYAALTGQEMRWDEALALPHRTMPEKLSWDSPPPALPDKDGQYGSPVPGGFKLV